MAEGDALGQRESMPRPATHRACPRPRTLSNTCCRLGPLPVPHPAVVPGGDQPPSLSHLGPPKQGTLGPRPTSPRRGQVRRAGGPSGRLSPHWRHPVRTETLVTHPSDGDPTPASFWVTFPSFQLIPVTGCLRDLFMFFGSCTSTHPRHAGQASPSAERQLHLGRCSSVRWTRRRQSPGMSRARPSPGAQSLRGGLCACDVA